MIANPFPLFEQFSDHLKIALFVKEDSVDVPLTDQQCTDGLGASQAAGLSQVHGNTTIVVQEKRERNDKADGMVTDTKSLALCIRTADCQSFVIYAPEKHVLGVLHAGWRGVIANAIPEYFAVLKQEWGIDPQETFVGAGPSLCQPCASFTDPTEELPGIDPSFFDGNCVNLQGIAKKQLLDLGVPPDNIDRHPDCTRCHPEKYWTYRGGDLDDVKAGLSNILVCALS